GLGSGMVSWSEAGRKVGSYHKRPFLRSDRPEARSAMTADIIAKDQEGRTVLLVKVKATSANEADVLGLFGLMESISPPVRFGMIVDPELIGIVDGRRDEPSSFAVSFPAVDVLRHYAPNFAGNSTP